jgi:hypothetical protein
MRTFVAAVALLFSAAACSSMPSLPSISPWQEAWAPDFPQPNSGEAAVYLIRGTAPQDAPPINLTIGRRAVGGLTGNTYYLFDLQPRLYDIRAFGTQTSAEQIITVAPGQTRFFQIEANNIGGTEILEVSSLDGRRMVRQGARLPQMADPPRD